MNGVLRPAAFSVLLCTAGSAEANAIIPYSPPPELRSRYDCLVSMMDMEVMDGCVADGMASCQADGTDETVCIVREWFAWQELRIGIDWDRPPILGTYGTMESDEAERLYDDPAYHAGTLPCLGGTSDRQVLMDGALIAAQSALNHHVIMTRRRMR